ncbi:MAG: PH domain-containing protein [Actinomycetota bacterium]|nr:PH domain-containing protein [Actinomycetota bacterium]
MRSWLAPGEQVIVDSRPQAKSLTGPAIAFVMVPALAGFALAWLGRGGLGRLVPQIAGWKPQLVLAVVVLAVAAELFYPLRRYLRWAAIRYTLTNRRIIVRRGWLHRSRQDFPLATVRNLGSRQSPLQRILRCGNIALDMGHGDTASLPDVPEAARFRDFALAAINELPHAALAGPGEDWHYAGNSDDNGWEGLDHGRR